MIKYHGRNLVSFGSAIQVGGLLSKANLEDVETCKASGSVAGKTIVNL